jgi:predicted ATPase
VIRQSGWPPSAAVHRFARELHAHTEGHPLFVRALLDELRAHGLLPGPDAPSAVPSEESIARLGVPDTLRQLIERQVDELTGLERTLLEGASVLGMEWMSAAAAVAAERDAAEVEPVLAGLARREAFVRRTGVGEWPDGTRSDAFAFVHAIHRSVLDSRLSSGRRTRIHRLIGERIEAAYSQHVREAAPQLAVHFEEAGDFDKAVRYLKLASETASRRGAAEEAHAKVARALELLGRTAASPLRDERELDLQIARGSVLMAARGWGAPEVEEAYDRARDLCGRMPPGAQLYRSLWGLWLFRWGRADLATAAALAEELERLSSRSLDRTCGLQTHHARWATAFSTGDLDAACRHARAGSALASSVECDLATYGQHDAGVCAQLFLARARAAAGDIDEGDRAAEEALARARDLDHPFTFALSLVFTAAVSHLAGRADHAGERAAEAASLSEAHGFRLLGAWAEALAGWALAQRSDGHRALSRIAAGVESAHATGSRQFRTYLLGILGEAHLKAGNLAPGLAAVNEALRWAGESGERFYEAELHRLRGGLIAASGGGLEEASADYDRAIAVASGQGARLFLERAIRDRSAAGHR